MSKIPNLEVLETELRKVADGEITNPSEARRILAMGRRVESILWEEQRLMVDKANEIKMALDKAVNAFIDG